MVSSCKLCIDSRRNLPPPKGGPAKFEYEEEVEDDLHNCWHRPQRLHKDIAQPVTWISLKHDTKIEVRQETEHGPSRGAFVRGHDQDSRRTPWADKVPPNASHGLHGSVRKLGRTTCTRMWPLRGPFLEREGARQPARPEAQVKLTTGDPEEQTERGVKRWYQKSPGCRSSRGRHQEHRPVPRTAR